VLGQQRQLAAGDLPDLQAAIDAGGDDVVASLEKATAVDPVLVATEGLHFLAGVAFDFPELDELVCPQETRC